MANPHNLKVNQEVVFVPIWHYSDKKERVMFVEKIGSRWAYLRDSAFRFDVNTLDIDGMGYSSPGCVKLSISEWKDEKQRDELVREIRLLALRAIPKHITTRQLEDFAELLRKT